uniref:DDE Tnp4 domain-containing protein n=1 Tax=Steinernema glaseri TaxID=37863 RepID=A0A1I7YPK6_9BILA
MSPEEALQLLLTIYTLRRRRARRIRRRYYVRPSHKKHLASRFRLFWIYYQSKDRSDLIKYLRLDREFFDALHSLLEEDLRKPITHRFPISSKERLAVFLRYAGHGGTKTLTFYSYAGHGGTIKSLETSFGIGKSTAQQIVKQAVASILSKLHMPALNSSFWLDRAAEFEQRWDFPHCIAAVDGKHFSITAPPKVLRSLYFNYEKFTSVTGLAWVDAYCRFVILEIGSPGRCSDAQIYKTSECAKHFTDGVYDVPAPSTYSNRTLPYVVVGDQGFGLSPILMRPFNMREAAKDRTKHEFNKRLSRARRVTENCFGVLVNRFRVLRGTLETSPNESTRLICALALLHNWIKTREMETNRTLEDEEEGEEEQLGNYEDYEEYGDESTSSASTQNSSTREGARVRNTFRSLFSSDEGRLHWQAIE